MSLQSFKVYYDVSEISGIIQSLLILLMSQLHCLRTEHSLLLCLYGRYYWYANNLKLAKSSALLQLLGTQLSTYSLLFCQINPLLCSTPLQYENTYHPQKLRVS